MFEVKPIQANGNIVFYNIPKDFRFVEIQKGAEPLDGPRRHSYCGTRENFFRPEASRVERGKNNPRVFSNTRVQPFDMK